jgi:hypothetical protein
MRWERKEGKGRERGWSVFGESGRGHLKKKKKNDAGA